MQVALLQLRTADNSRQPPLQEQRQLCCCYEAAARLYSHESAAVELITHITGRQMRMCKCLLYSSNL
jgi:hypothetical protein